MHKLKLIWILFSISIMLVACSGEDDPDDDGDSPDGDSLTDGDSPEDGDSLTDGDSREDGDNSADGDFVADGDVISTEETWEDRLSGLSWQNSDEKDLNHDSAVAYCGELSLGGYEDWRLPTIDELRSLVRGCPDTMPSGSCGVTESCLESACQNTECVSCERDEGPGTNGRYLPPELSGDWWWYWSSSEVADIAGNAWSLNFNNGGVNEDNQSSYIQARCVR